jgi:probable DNA repair protein
MYDTLFQTAVEQALSGATVVTENKRAARRLMAACEARLRSAATAWLTPDVLPLESWLQRLWQECLLSGVTNCVLLNDYQTTVLWEQTIAGDDSAPLGNRAGTAVAAAQAWGTLHEYGIPLAPVPFAAQPETQAFYGWAQRYERSSAAQRWIDGARLSDVLCPLLSRIAASIRNYIVFYAFNELTPRHQRLIAALLASGKQVNTLLPEYDATDYPHVCTVAAADAKTELYAAARWAAAKLRRDPDTQVGIVVARLSELRAEAEFIFTEVLHPESLVATNLGSRSAFDLSLGPSLESYPVINTALLAAEIAFSSVTTHDAGVLIRSPYLGGQSAESGQRANFDLFLRGHAGLQVSAEQVVAAYDHSENRSRTPHLQKIFSRLKALATTKSSQSLPPSKWADVIGKLLAAAGWPGNDEGSRPLDSSEYQTVQAWTELLSQLGRLDAILPSLTAVEALQRLRRMTADKPFKPEDIGAPVQIMGMLEATGSTFDHLWVLGLSDDVWPPRGTATPLLPIALQIAANVPHCIPAQEFEFAARVTARLVQSGADVVLSWPKRQEDRALRPSPLLANVICKPEDEVCGPPHSSWAELQSGVNLEEFATGQAPPLDARDLYPGGTRVFELQSNCPFHAFAELRLGAVRLDEPEPGIRAKDRGKVIEKALELVWDQLHDHQTLVNKERAELDQIVSNAVDEALKLLEAVSEDWEHRYRELERKRLFNLLNEWLELEKKREAFKVIAHQRAVVVSAGGISVKGRIDRIDQTNGGELVILDYKTGGGSYGPGQWKGSRPERPQLQLYVASQEEPVAAVAFALLRTGDCALKGYGARTDILAQRRDMTAKYFAPGDTFEQHIGKWNGVLDEIGQAYAAGIAKADPLPERVCDHCHLPAFCRVSELQGADVNREEGEASDDE